MGSVARAGWEGGRHRRRGAVIPTPQSPPITQPRGTAWVRAPRLTFPRAPASPPRNVSVSATALVCFLVRCRPRGANAVRNRPLAAPVLGRPSASPRCPPSPRLPGLTPPPRPPSQFRLMSWLCSRACSRCVPPPQAPRGPTVHSCTPICHWPCGNSPPRVPPPAGPVVPLTWRHHRQGCVLETVPPPRPLGRCVRGEHGARAPLPSHLPAWRPPTTRRCPHRTAACRAPLSHL